MIVIRNIIKDEENVIGESKYKNLENPENPTKADYEIMENYLKGCPHIKTLYINKNGRLSIAKFQYTGPFKELKHLDGKFYSRMDTREMSEFNSVKKRYMSKKYLIPISDYEIVGEYNNKNFIKYEVKNKYDYDVKRFLFDNYKKFHY